MATDQPGPAPARRPTVLALGAWLKNVACRLDGAADATGPQWSAVHGDLGQAAACVALEASARALVASSPQPVAAIAHDLHPDFFSTRLAHRLAAELGVPTIAVQHHHAHIAAVQAEHGLTEAVIGLALDGFGLGSDGQAWGGELLWLAGAHGAGDAGHAAGWQRLGHLQPLALPGGDAAARQPWRMAAAALHALGRADEIVPRLGPLVGHHSAQTVAQMLARGLNSPPTSSAGRWFDAAAAALGLSHHQAHEAEAAMALEAAAQRGLLTGIAGDSQPGSAPAGQTGTGTTPATTPDTPPSVLDLRPLLARLLDTPRSPAAVDAAAAWFHHALADALAGWAAHAARQHRTTTVCLGGGCLLNSVLRQGLAQRLQAHGLQACWPQHVACGDAGLALGQAWVAAQQVRTTRPAAQATITTPESPPCALPFQPA